MGDIVKLALRLFIFALVASVLLAITNEVTKGPIEAQKLASKMTALNTVLPGCELRMRVFPKTACLTKSLLARTLTAA